MALASRGQRDMDTGPEAIADAMALALDPATEARLAPRFTAIHEALRRDADRSACEAIAELVESSR